MKQFIKFSMIGVANTVIHFGVFYLFYALLGFYHLMASGLGFCLAVINSYLMNKAWTFKTSGTSLRSEFMRFFIVSLLALLLNLLSMALMVEILMMNPLLAQLLTIIITLMVNFSGNKYWSFRPKKTEA